MPPTPAMFQPMFFAVLQGTKALRIAAHQLELRGGSCAVTSFGLPYVGQIHDATRAAPYIAVGLDLDLDLLTNVMLDMPKTEDRWACSAACGTLEGSLGDAFTRLTELAATPDDRRVLGRLYEAELYYWLLQSPMGNTLRQLGQRDSRSRQIKIAADWLCANPEKPVIIPDLAAKVGMSLTSFHRHFKVVTGYSPLAFQRQIRLIGARRLLLGGGVSVSRAAYKVGYVSPSQFSREYKNLFGVPPIENMIGTARDDVT
jgi:AraC-like DNA-binding protein